MPLALDQHDTLRIMPGRNERRVNQTRPVQFIIKGTNAHLYFIVFSLNSVNVPKRAVRGAHVMVNIKKKILLSVFIAAAFMAALTTVANAKTGDTRPGWGYGDQNHIHTGPPGTSVVAPQP
jgi:hypothetical protein